MDISGNEMGAHGIEGIIMGSGTWSEMDTLCVCEREREDDHKKGRDKRGLRKSRDQWPFFFSFCFFSLTPPKLF